LDDFLTARATFAYPLAYQWDRLLCLSYPGLPLALGGARACCGACRAAPGVNGHAIVRRVAGIILGRGAIVRARVTVVV
jgi:hypothetical protein